MKNGRETISRKRKLLYTLVVMAAFLALAEAGLRLHGALALRSARGNAPEDRDRVILCLGDSFTYGIGAGASRSYPVQLQEKINKRHPEGVRVVNLGHPYMDSTSLLAELPKNLKNWNPDVVVLLVGYNNRYREHVGPAWSGGRAFFKRHFGALRLYKLARIMWINANVDPNARIDARVPALTPQEIAGVLQDDEGFAGEWALFAPFVDRAEPPPPPGEEGDVADYNAYALYLLSVDRAPEAESVFRGALEMDRENLLATMGLGYITLYRQELVMGFRKARFGLDSSWLLTGMGYLRMDMGDLAGAVRHLSESRRVEAYFVAAPHGLAIAYLRLGRPDDALFHLLAAEVLEPWSSEIQWTKGDILMMAGEGALAVKAFEKSLEYSHYHPGHYARIARMWAERPARPDEEFQEDAVLAAWGPRARDWLLIGDWTSKVLAGRREARAAKDLLEDLDDIADLLEIKGVPLVLMSYPDTFYRKELSRFAEKRNLDFVDHVPAYKKELRTKKPEDLFRRDGHCTPAGYGIMAEELLKTLDRLGLSKPRPRP